jgi:hypothetical protein
LVVTEPGPELVAAVDDAMVAALDDMGPLLRAIAAKSPLLKEVPTADDMIEQLKRDTGRD